MPDHPVVVKLGGDALASPERIAAEARRLARLAGRGPVVAVASARRGITDRLLELVGQVGSEARRHHPAAGTHPAGPDRRAQAEADRAVASGEVVSAALLALALNELGVPAVSLDAREAGVTATGRFGGARIRQIDPRRIRRRLAQGLVPVITGFQGWRRGRVATLARGGTDSSAVALAGALDGGHVIFVKDAEGLRTADPRLVPASRPIAAAPHHFLTALTAAGARVVQAEAAALAEARGVTLEFCSLGTDAPLSSVTASADGAGLRAVASRAAGEGMTFITAVAGEPGGIISLAEPCRQALSDEGITVLDRQPAADGLRFLVPEEAAVDALRTIHRVLVEEDRRCSGGVRRAG